MIFLCKGAFKVELPAVSQRLKLKLPVKAPACPTWRIPADFPTRGRSSRPAGKHPSCSSQRCSRSGGMDRRMDGQIDEPSPLEAFGVAALKPRLSLPSHPFRPQVLQAEQGIRHF